MSASRILGAVCLLARRGAPWLRGSPHHQAFSSSAAMAARVHLQLESKDGVGIVKFDSPDSRVNTLSEAVMNEFKEILEEVEKDNSIKSVVLISGKPDCFIAGADIGMLQSCKSAAEVENISQEGQNMLKYVAEFPKPVIGAIMGSCLGGGLEVALATHYRIAMKDSKTQLGVPEVLLGLLPGAGGTQRLAKTVSLTNAFDMMLTGRNIRPDKAKKMGLVDAVVDALGPGLKSPQERTRDYLEEVAIQTAKGLVNGSVKKTPRKKNLVDKIMDFILQYPFGKNYVLGQVKGRVMKQTQGLYPAPLKIIEVVKTSLEQGTEAGYKAESKAFGELAMTPESNALMGLFHGQTACKKNAFGKPQRPVKNLGILGAGLMGAGVAQVSIDKDFHVTLKDMAMPGLLRGIQQIENGLKQQVKKKKISSFKKDEILSNLNSTVQYEGFDKLDMVIEAVFEDINIKHKVIKEVEALIPEHCIFASNTSALPIAKIAEASKRPEKVIGMHYFSPVDKMALMEIITTEKTSNDTIASAVDVSLRQGKTVIVVKDSPGFYTSRCIVALLVQNLIIMQEGLDPVKIDKLSKSMGFPVGGATLMDEVGMDVGMHIGEFMSNAMGDRFSTKETLALGREIIAKGFFGRKAGKGIYLYSDDSKDKPVNTEALEIIKKHASEPKLPLEDNIVKDRLLLRFVDEAVSCYQDGILRNPVEGDIGLVFGLGFPPNLGGPFRYVDQVGADKIVARLDEFAAHYGDIVAPCQLLRDMAKDPTRKFHKN